MARSNKYASLNFNDIYEKKVSPNTLNKQQSPSSPSINNKTIISNSRIHGNMLVLSRPTPKPISQQLPQPLSSSSPPPSPSPQQQYPPDQIRSEKPDSISLRPLGHTGSSPSLVQSALTSPVLGKDKDLLASSPKSNRFVPPHLRPGFAGREEKPAVPGARPAVNRQGNFVSPSPYNGEEARPKSGGGYERMRRGFEPDPAVVVNRPGSSGARLSSTG